VIGFGRLVTVVYVEAVYCRCRPRTDHCLGMLVTFIRVFDHISSHISLFLLLDLLSSSFLMTPICYEGNDIIFMLFDDLYIGEP